MTKLKELQTVSSKLQITTDAFHLVFGFTLIIALSTKYNSQFVATYTYVYEESFNRWNNPTSISHQRRVDQIRSNKERFVWLPSKYDSQHNPI